MDKLNETRIGFTLVELLIVIVVVAILAAISVVAYNGIQDRAADAAVQSDVRSIAAKVREYKILNGVYPNGGSTTTFPGGISHSVNRQAYEQEGVNLYYCTIHSGDDARFGVAAKSRSGKVFAYYNGSFQDYSGVFSASTNICPNIGIPTGQPNYEFHYGKTSAGAWASWTN